MHESASYGCAVLKQLKIWNKYRLESMSKKNSFNGFQIDEPLNPITWCLKYDFEKKLSTNYHTILLTSLSFLMRSNQIVSKAHIFPNNSVTSVQYWASHWNFLKFLSSKKCSLYIIIFQKCMESGLPVWIYGKKSDERGYVALGIEYGGKNAKYRSS